MTWIRKSPPKADDHRCAVPMVPILVNPPPASLCAPGMSRAKVRVGDEPEGAVGDVWMCDECLRVWRVALNWRYISGNGTRAFYREWVRAGWWKSRRARRAVGWV